MPVPCEHWGKVLQLLPMRGAWELGPCDSPKHLSVLMFPALGHLRPPLQMGNLDSVRISNAFLRGWPAEGCFEHQV